MLWHAQVLEHLPPPRFLTMPAVGIDISDYSVKFLEFVPHRGGFAVGRFGDEKILPGVVASGRIKNHRALVEILAEMKRKYNLHFVRASLPEELGFLFDASVPRGVSRAQARGTLEFVIEEHVPIPPDETVFDFDYIHGGTTTGKTQPVVVSAFPRTEVESYTELFTQAGLMPLSLEIEAQALARAVVPHDDYRTHLIVDFGKRRSGISIVGGGVTRFAATVDVGGDTINEAIRAALPDADDTSVDMFKNTQGLHGFTDHPKTKETLDEVASKLADAISKYSSFWGTHVEAQSADTTIAQLHLCGGNANLSGLPEYLSTTVGIPAQRARVWDNALSLEQELPPIHFRHSLGYAPAIGLALNMS